MDSTQPLSKFAHILITPPEHKRPLLGESGGTISVNPLVSKLAAWYEKVRNAMDYRDQEVILRVAIERILKRRFLMGKKGKDIAFPLIRELVWARYFPDASVQESAIEKVSQKIDLYMQLQQRLLSQKVLPDAIVIQFIFHVLSSDIEQLLHPNTEKDVIVNAMYHLLRKHVHIADEPEQTRDVQVFIAVRKAYAKDDLAFLRYYLFLQIFGELTAENLESVVTSFKSGYEEIQNQLLYVRRGRISNYVANKTPIFVILEDVWRAYGTGFKDLIEDKEALEKAVFEACDVRYKGISGKVRGAIIKSVIFLILSKVVIAFGVEGTLEQLFYGEVMWNAMAINITIPPLLMIIVGFFIKTPGIDNSKRILHYIRQLLFADDPNLGAGLSIRTHPLKAQTTLDSIFAVSWALAFCVSFGILIYILTHLGFTPISQAIFLFFLAIVSFLSFRIALISRTYMVESKPGLLSPIVDFFFMPMIRVGQRLTDGISQINIFMFILDYILEIPFKGLFGFFEQWFFFLHAKREGVE